MLDRTVMNLPETAATEAQLAVNKATSSMLPLVTSGLTLTIDNNTLIDRVDLTIDEPGITIIMGANGAGKSLLLRMLHGLVAPTAGAIHWNGQPIGDAARKRQAMVFQRPVLLRRSVAANVDFALALSGPSDATRRDELLALVGLLDRSRQPARLLSGGEQQRLALARALATSPEVLFLDEPTASLDPASVLMIEEIVTKARASGIKIIFVTHDIGQARRLADEVVFLHRGRRVEQCNAASFFDSPTSEAARAYLEGRIIL
ncbi:MAG: ATP-binding cassette domain-containing protein [Hyphomicrobiaceae bacterium]|nr:ATP-binding cassette domain-containing protein [Hyphomicrobiaceae bacterium]